MQVKDVIQKTTQFFRDKGFESPRLDTELLLASALRWERMKLYLNYEYPLSDEELASCRELVRRRGSGEPVAYILGEKGFYSHSFKVTKDVLIPRPETETLVESAIEWMKVNASSARIVDLGTGSGCIGLSLLAALPESSLLAVDISEAALGIARENAELLGVSTRAKFHAGDASDLSMAVVEAQLGALADVVVANPPYIAPNDPDVQENVRKFEPATALFSGADGLEHIRKWSFVAGVVARAGAFTMFEIGHDQGRVAKEIFESTGFFENVEIVRDLAGHERFVRAQRKTGS
ncbi:MAG: peptide chain release factor N(5)-glutamine methyltransferase, partial [Bdellovibrionota bacterium]